MINFVNLKRILICKFNLQIETMVGNGFSYAWVLKRVGRDRSVYVYMYSVHMVEYCIHSQIATGNSCKFQNLSVFFSFKYRIFCYYSLLLCGMSTEKMPERR